MFISSKNTIKLNILKIKDLQYKNIVLIHLLHIISEDMDTDISNAKKPRQLKR